MKNVFNISIALSVILISSGCNMSSSGHKIKNNQPNSAIDGVTKVTKTFRYKEGNSNIVISLYNNIKSIKIINGLDSKLFSIVNKNIKLNITPKYSNPKDYNKDNIYEVKVLVIDNRGFKYNVFIKLYITKSNSSENGGGNNGGGKASEDLDGDYIPDNIEKMLGMSSKNPDENQDGIVDGLEGDPLFNKQWYIKAEGTPTNESGVSSIVGNDLNLFEVYKKYMGYNNGNPVILQIVDSGIEVDHEDLKDNIDLSRSLNNDKQGEPTPGGFFTPHGTMLAGIAAARAFNNKGIRGVAPFAKIAGSNWLVSQSLDGLEAAWLSGDGANEIAVSNNSWGRYYTIDTFYEDILAEGSKKLRDGKGRLYVFASGNSRTYNADANTQYILNNRYPIVVGALNVENKVANYSTPGANLWVTAYGGAANYTLGPTIATTYLMGKSPKTWDEDINKNYTYAMAGSSAAAPMVSAEIGLILEACPNLTWRDVKYILAKSSKQVDISNKSWITNSAGFHFSRDYGFGLIDAKKAIDICKNGYNNLPSSKSTEAIKSIGGVDIDKSSQFSINIDKNMKIEWIEATVDLDTQNASDFDIYLISPSGTKILLIKNGTKIGSTFIPDGNWMKGGFRFGTGAFIDEESIGEWKIELDNKGSNSAKLKSLKLKIYGY